MKSSPIKVQLPGANELKERLSQSRNENAKLPLLGKLGKKSPEQPKKTEEELRFKRLINKEEPIQVNHNNDRHCWGTGGQFSAT